MADITDTTLRTDVEQIRYLFALMNEYDLYQKDISALSTVGFLTHANVEMNDGVILRSNQAIRESHVVTARKMTSLYKHARNVNIFPTYAIPASMNFILLVEENDFLSNATKKGDVYTFTVSIDNFITVGSYIYSFDYPIELRLEEGVGEERYLTARYVMGGEINPISDLTNPTIKTVRQKDKKGYIYQIYVKLKQYHREYYPKTITNRDNEYARIETGLVDAKLVISENMKDDIKEGAAKVIILKHPDEAAKIKDKLAKELGDEYEVAMSKPFFIEVNDKGISKGASLDSLCKKLGLTNENVMALGDGLNDLSMIEFAGLGVAVENGNSILKEAADFISKSNDEDGFAYAIEKFVLNK